MTTISQKQLHDKAAKRNRLPGVNDNKEELHAGYTTEEVFDELDRKLIDHFGEEYRILANERRSQWNEKSSWKFQQL
jgi:hypothetical protein